MLTIAIGEAGRWRNKDLTGWEGVAKVELKPNVMGTVLDHRSKRASQKPLR